MSQFRYDDAVHHCRVSQVFQDTPHHIEIVIIALLKEIISIRDLRPHLSDSIRGVFTPRIWFSCLVLELNLVSSQHHQYSDMLTISWCSDIIDNQNRYVNMNQYQNSKYVTVFIIYTANYVSNLNTQLIMLEDLGHIWFCLWNLIWISHLV